MAHGFLTPFMSKIVLSWLPCQGSWPMSVGLRGCQLIQRALHGAAQVVLHADLGLPDGVLDALGLG